MATLDAVAQKYVLHWGELGSRWGINRTVAQIHALLYLSPQPLHAESIADALQIARSNVSTSLRELQGWGIVRTVHVLGDRRDHFEATKDVWQMFSILIGQRRAREIDPTLAVLRECAHELDGPKANKYTRERVREMLELFEVGTSLINEVHGLPIPLLKSFLRLRGKVKALLTSARS